MMSDKRFKVLSGGFDEEGNPLYLIKDTTDMIGDWEMCKKVIEQQATIQSLKEENEKLKQGNDRFADTVAKQVSLLIELRKENEQLKSLVNACEYGQKSLMKEMKHNDEALDKIWEIMKELYGVIDDE